MVGRIAHVRELVRGVSTLFSGHSRSLICGTVLVLLSRLASFGVPLAAGLVVDNATAKTAAIALKWPALIALASILLNAYASYAAAILFAHGAQSLIADTRCKLQRHLCSLPIAFFDHSQGGDLASRIMTDVEAFRFPLSTGVFDFFGSVVTLLAAVILMFVLNVRMACFTTCFNAALAIVLIRGTITMRPLFYDRAAIFGKVGSRLLGLCAGIKVVKNFCREDQESEGFMTGVQLLKDRSLTALTFIAKANAATTLLVGTMTGIAMILGAVEIQQQRLTLGGLVVFLTILPFMNSPISQIAGIGAQIAEFMASVDRIQEILRQGLDSHERLDAVMPGRICGTITFDGVHFGYEASAPVLSDVSFKCPSGSTTAIIGPSGSGKSTIAHLIVGFYSPTNGRVCVDGIDISTVNPRSYRKCMALVSQDTFLFDGTILENIAFARPNASKKEILNACRIASVDEFLEQLVDGYDTLVGERGVRLSTGQRQRVAIARAVLSDPAVLILDEATSNVDYASEELIQQALQELMGTRTVLIIAHRFSAVRHADQILVVERGRIVERGIRKDLYTLGDRYCGFHAAESQRVWNHQTDTIE